MKRLAVGAFVATLLLSGSVPALAQTGDMSSLTAPSSDQAQPDYEAYIGRPEAINCLDVGSQANAQSILRADPSDPMQLDSDRNGIACEVNPEPRDMKPVPR